MDLDSCQYCFDCTLWIMGLILESFFARLTTELWSSSLLSSGKKNKSVKSIKFECGSPWVMKALATRCYSSPRMVIADIRSFVLIYQGTSEKKNVRCINISHPYKSPREHERSIDEVTISNSAEHFNNTTTIYLTVITTIASFVTHLAITVSQMPLLKTDMREQTNTCQWG